MKKVKKKWISLVLSVPVPLLLLAAVVLLNESLPVSHPLRPVLAVAIGLLTLACLLLPALWFAGRPSRPAHAASVLLRVFYCAFLFAMACQIVRDAEIGRVTRDTWITAGVLAVGILAFCAPKIFASLRGRASYRKADHVAMGTIYRVIGETHLDLDGDPVTLDYALIRYDVDGAPYETRADVSRVTVRRFGKDAFIGRRVPVYYDPADPAGAFADRIDRHFFDK